MNPLGPILIPVASVPPMSYVGPTPPIPLTTNRSWAFVDTFGPPPPLELTVSTTHLMENPVIPLVPGSNHIMTPNVSGTQYMPVSTSFMLAPGPLTSATYSAPYNVEYSMVSKGPINNPFGWYILFSSNPLVQMLEGNVPNMHILTGNVTVPPLFIGQYGQSLLDMNLHYFNQGPIINYVASGIPQQGPTQSIWAPHSQSRMSQRGFPYPDDIYNP